VFTVRSLGWLARGAIILALVFLLCGPPRLAEAHALLQRSVPTEGAVLERAPDAVLLVFTEQPEPTLSSIHVLDSGGRPVETSEIQPVRGQPHELRLAVPGLSPGVYTVTWRTVSRIDGHVAGGAFSFGVGEAPSAAPPLQPKNPPPSTLYVISRLLLYVGLSGLLAIAVTSAAMPPAEGVYVWVLWAAAAAGLILLGVAQAQDTQAGMDRLLRTPLGHALWWRAVPLAAALGAAAIAQRRAELRRSAAAALAMTAAAAMLAQVVAGHAGAGSGLHRAWNVAVQWIHFVGIGAWAGALASTLLIIRVAPIERRIGIVRRLSMGAAIGLGTVGITGALRAIDGIGTWSAVLTTTFGKLVVVKTGLFVVLALLGAFARRLALPGAPKNVRTFSSIVVVEMLVAVGALAITAFMTGLVPPAATREATAVVPTISATGSDYATSVRVRLTVSPGLPGINRFTAAISDYDTRRPVAANRITLRFTKPDRPDIGPSSLPLSPQSVGLYAAEGANLSLDGGWSVVVVVERSGGAVEVPLELTARRAPPTERTIRSPGQPPIYVIALSGGRQLSLYLDPGIAGFNALHGTFVDAQGRELSLARPPDVSASRGGGERRALPVLQEGPGHFSADAELGSGAWQLVIVATTQTGETLRAELTIQL